MVARLAWGLLLAGLSACVVLMGFGHFYPLDPALDQTHKYERRIHLTTSFPFITSYLLYRPSGIDPRREYPMVLALHGGYRRSLAAFVMAQDDFQDDYPTFVVMPMAPFRQAWADPHANDAGALPMAVDIVADLVGDLPIDRDRIYVTGSSKGAIGTFGALARFGDVFAAGVPVNGFWPAADAAAFRSSSVAIYHGVDDPLFPVADTKRLARAIRSSGGNLKLVEMTDVGHDSWPAYRDPGLWRWLFAQRL